MDPSFLQHLEEPGPAKGIKYGIIIIILQLSIILSLSYVRRLSVFLTQMHTHYFPLEASDGYGSARVRAKMTCAHTHTHAAEFPIGHSGPAVQSVHADRRICAL